MSEEPANDALRFLAGGGEMGARLRTFDWAATPLGPPERWPPTLRALVGVMLGSGQPMFVAWGPARTMIYNDGYAPLCGAKHPWALGRPFKEVWADILDAVGPIMNRAYAGVATHMDDITFTMRDRHGYEEETHFEFSYTPVREARGAVAGVFCACSETTSRVLTQRRLRFMLELSERLRRLPGPRDVMELATQAVGRHLGVGRVGYAEIDGAGEFFVVEHDWTDGGMASIAGRDRVARFGAIAEALRAGETVRVDDVRADPRLEDARPALDAIGVGSAITVPLIENGRFVAAFFVHHAARRRWRDDEEALVKDVAERTWEAVRRARSEWRLLEEHRRKDEFLATLAHELRNPLAPLATGLRILEHSGGDALAAARVREMMHRQFTHLVRLIDDLLDLSRVSRGLIELRTERVEFERIVESAVETSLPLIEAGRHELSVLLPPGPLPLEADPIRLAQVFSNLLNNAAKYTPAGGKITLACTRESGEVVVRVSDTGIGIPPDMLRTVFEMFTQVRGRADHVQAGLGIGLTLVRRLTEMHGGTVTAESDGRGSTFTVRLPLAEAAEERTVPGDGAARLRAPGCEALRVLVVDDNADAVEMLSMLVELQGHTTGRAHSGPEALEMAETFRPDVVFLDIGLPGMDGYQVARELRHRVSGGSLLLIALTGWGSDEDQQRSREAGFDHHLTKPADPDAIASLLSRVSQRDHTAG
jgi:signal transduction histidine kinase/ActR/RegA family two-component response regulator